MIDAKKLSAALGVVTAFLLSCGIAAAAWNSTGSGTVAAKAGTASALTTGVSGTAQTTGLLYPNGPAGDAVIVVNNPNPYPVVVTSVSPAAGAVTATGGTGTCTTSGVVFVAKTGLSISVAANASTTATVTGAVTMSVASQDGCQGATFTIPVTFAGQST